MKIAATVLVWVEFPDVMWFHAVDIMLGVNMALSLQLHGVVTTRICHFK